MNCKQCGNDVHIGGKICPWCGVLLSNLEAGVVASAGRRLGGYLLDLVVCGFLYMLLMGSLISESSELVVVSGLIFLTAIIIHLVLLAKGKSYGKWMLGMRVYYTTGEPAGFWIMLLRETIGKFVSGLVFSLGYLWLLWDRDRQTWHDKLMNTTVMLPKVSPKQS